MSVTRLKMPEDARGIGVSIIKQFSVRETYPLHCHDFAELFFVGRGRAMHSVNGSFQLLEQGSLVYIRPDDVHCFSPINYFDFVMYSLGFVREEANRAAAFLELPLPDGELPPHTVTRGALRASLETQLGAMLAAPASRKLPIFRAMLPQALLSLISPPDPERPASLPPWLAALDADMRQRENYIAGLPRMLEMCSYSQEYLNRMFRLHMKTTPTEYINALRMEYATELLTQGGRSVTEICFLTGFNSLSYFYSVFRRLYGCAPREFLRRRG